MKLWTFNRVLTYTGNRQRIEAAHRGGNDSVRGFVQFKGLGISEQRTKPCEVELPSDQIDPEQLYQMAIEAFERLDAGQRERFEQLYFPSEDV